MGIRICPLLARYPASSCFVHFSLLAYGVVAFLHGGSPFKVWQPDSFRIRLNRRSTFNYGWDIIAGKPRLAYFPLFPLIKIAPRGEELAATASAKSPVGPAPFSMNARVLFGDNSHTGNS
jgi:hypothetical protein